MLEKNKIESALEEEAYERDRPREYWEVDVKGFEGDDDSEKSGDEQGDVSQEVHPGDEDQEGEEEEEQEDADEGEAAETLVKVEVEDTHVAAVKREHPEDEDEGERIDVKRERRNRERLRGSVDVKQEHIM
ncbi:hypothetical protein L198_07148 [Cryptococcus wingfieldii CBS 7118]|uniref:Uncharacterized protein n=1 Tax=Cryptococcus wingfieldii CBS 7118 TaxID=1295528 RepID=A0A1E3IFE4_9TREE|nr:hypothetical protein L198_07148 [Cryptococcus wingfieldii CBS 7118]ODN87145.1 hypothetical protein L198_07148 [Cryptococcus wingfieldii CBS 7118]